MENRTILGTGYLITSAASDRRSVHAAERRGSLAALQSMDYLFSNLYNNLKIDLRIAADFLGVIRKLEKQVKVISMVTSLHHIVREFLLIRSRILKTLKLIKVEAHQDDFSSF